MNYKLTEQYLFVYGWQHSNLDLSDPWLVLCSLSLSDRGLWLPGQAAVRAMSSSGASSSSPYSTLAVSHPAEFITHVEINRPEKRNAMNKAFWR